jgi:adenylosuccinate synthase
MIDVLLGLQWGDEGKGKIVDYLSDRYQMVARFQGGPNAGHSLKINGQSFVLNTIPSGIFRPGCLNLIGNGVVIDPIKLKTEIEKVQAAGADVMGQLYISKKAHLILPTHILLDAASERAKGDAKIGSTLRGISPTYQDKTGRAGLRIGDMFAPDFKNKYQHLVSKHLKMIEFLGGDTDFSVAESLWFEAVDFLKTIKTVDGEYFIHEHLSQGKQVLAEGAQGSMLDVDFGTYPFVTSSNTISAGACTGLGVAPQKIRKVFGVFKAYCTRVGSGPFPTELNDEMGEMLRQKGNEFGATTGRPRRTGWLDLPALQYAIMLNGVTDLMMTKADVLCGFENVSVCDGYEINGVETSHIPYEIVDAKVVPKLTAHEGWDDSLNSLTAYTELPQTFQNYIHYIENYVKLPISLISTGPEREKTFIK